MEICQWMETVIASSSVFLVSDMKARHVERTLYFLCRESQCSSIFWRLYLTSLARNFRILLNFSSIASIFLLYYFSCFCSLLLTFSYVIDLLNTSHISAWLVCNRSEKAYTEKFLRLRTSNDNLLMHSREMLSVAPILYEILSCSKWQHLKEEL